jgi:hypothetical protein
VLSYLFGGDAQSRGDFVSVAPFGQELQYPLLIRRERPSRRAVWFTQGVCPGSPLQGRRGPSYRLTSPFHLSQQAPDHGLERSSISSQDCSQPRTSSSAPAIQVSVPSPPANRSTMGASTSPSERESSPSPPNS